MTKWAVEFKHCRLSIFDDKRSGHPKTAATEVLITKIQITMLNGSRMRVRKLADIANISTDRVHIILYEHLHTEKLSTRWAPRFLTI